jgi:hypothetical protein
MQRTLMPKFSGIVFRVEKVKIALRYAVVGGVAAVMASTSYG